MFAVVLIFLEQAASAKRFRKWHKQSSSWEAEDIVRAFSAKYMIRSTQLDAADATKQTAAPPRSSSEALLSMLQDLDKIGVSSGVEKMLNNDANPAYEDLRREIRQVISEASGKPLSDTDKEALSKKTVVTLAEIREALLRGATAGDTHKA